MPIDKPSLSGTCSSIPESTDPNLIRESVSSHDTGASHDPLTIDRSDGRISNRLIRPDETTVKSTSAYPPVGGGRERRLEKVEIEFCSIHDNEPKCIFCTGCSVSCCMKCAVKHHFAHNYLTSRLAAPGTVDGHSQSLQECAEMLVSLHLTETKAEAKLTSEFEKLTLALERRKTVLDAKIREIANTNRDGFSERLVLHLSALAGERDVDVTTPYHSRMQISFKKLDTDKLLRSIERFGHIGSNAFGPNCTAFGSNLSTAVIREPLRFKVQARDHLGAVVGVGGDEVLANVHAFPLTSDQFGWSYPADVKDCRNGTFLVSAVFYHPGNCQLSVNVNGEAIQGSPFKVKNSNNIAGYKLIKKVTGKYTRCNPPSSADSREVSTDSGVGSDGFQNENSLFCRPWGVCCAPNGTSFVANRSSNEIKLFDANHVLILTLGSYGTSAGEFKLPSGVAFDSRLNRLVVCDKDNHRIQVFDMHDIPFGKVSPTQSVSVTPVRMFGQFGSHNGEFRYPWDCAVSPVNSEIVISDSHNKRIQLFTSDGAYLSKYEADLRNLWKFDFPRGVAFSPSNRIVVSDFNNNRILVFNTKMVIEKKFGREGSALGKLNRPQGVAVDDRGNIIVSDSRNYRIQIFAPNGNIRHAFGTSGNGKKNDEMDRPAGVSVSPKGEILVVDFGNNRMLVFQR